MSATIKAGDTFALPIQFKDADTGEIYPIPQNMTFMCQIRDMFDNIIAYPEVKYTDIANGLITIYVHYSATADWKAGKAKLDIRAQVGDTRRHSADFVFTIERSITRGQAI